MHCLLALYLKKNYNATLEWSPPYNIKSTMMRLHKLSTTQIIAQFSTLSLSLPSMPDLPVEMNIS